MQEGRGINMNLAVRLQPSLKIQLQGRIKSQKKFFFSLNKQQQRYYSKINNTSTTSTTTTATTVTTICDTTLLKRNKAMACRKLYNV